MTRIEATWDYMRQPEFAIAFNRVRQGVRTELAHIELYTGIEDLVAWWDAWSEDYFAWVESTLHTRHTPRNHTLTSNS
jgi:hypothetical protein